MLVCVEIKISGFCDRYSTHASLRNNVHCLPFLPKYVFVNYMRFIVVSASPVADIATKFRQNDAALKYSIVSLNSLKYCVGSEKITSSYTLS